MLSREKISIVLVDDHSLFRKGMFELINKFEPYKVIWEAGNGKELIRLLNGNPIPDVVLLDVAMPEMDGFETATWLKSKFPAIKILVLSMFDQEETIIKMLKLGVNGFVLKDAEPDELKEALDQIISKGFYYSDIVCGTMANSIKSEPKKKPGISLNEREIKFLELASSELTYKEIADIMCLSYRTIDGYRDSLFAKLNVKSRVGLALYAIRNGIAKVS
jgi:two-component system, NarL family, invasion response regulator UvrY